MLGWIGAREAGVVEVCGDEGVVTEFWSAVIPLVPRASYYRSRDREGRPTSTPILLHRRSVIGGYLRTPVALAALVVTMPVLAAPARWLFLWPLALVLCAVAAWLAFGYGRLDRAERDRRELLRRVVGLGAPPDLLPPSTRAQIRAALEEAWSRHVVRWPDAILAGAADELLVALAEYHGQSALAELARTNLARGDDLPETWN